MVLVLPMRNPLVVAKTVASIDQLSGGRVILGTAAGWLEAEFDALGVPSTDMGFSGSYGVYHSVYDNFRWMTYETEHFVIYFYPEIRPHLERMAEQLSELEHAGRVTDPDYAELQHEYDLLGGYTLDQRVDEALSGLGFSRPEWARPPTALSGGQQTRAALARLVVTKADGEPARIAVELDLEVGDLVAHEAGLHGAADPTESLFRASREGAALEDDAPLDGG